MTISHIEVQEQGTPVSFSFDEMMRYSGPGSPGGVALGFKVMERALPLVEPHGLAERRELLISTPFRGPGARDACELVTRGLTEDRYVIDPGLERPERGHALTTFAFRVTYRNRAVSLLLRQGLVTDEFVGMAQAPWLSEDDQRTFTKMKQDLANQLMTMDAAEVFEVE